jgi:putative integral membrane protein (TIGR02587 family)
MTEVKKTAVAYARGLAGGMLIGVPVLMTMEVWWEGFFVPAWRILLLYVFNFGVLLILQHYSGLHHRKTRAGQIRAAFVAYGLGITASAIILVLLHVIRGDSQLRDIAGKLLLESVPVSIGSSVAMSEFGGDDEGDVAEKRKEEVGFFGSLGMAIAGAAVFGFGLSAAEEPLMIGNQLDWPHAIALVLVSLMQVYLIVHAVGFRAKKNRSKAPVSRISAQAVSTYAVAILVGVFYLWVFGTINEHLSLTASVYSIVAMSFVTSFGAAAGEVIL